MFKAVALLSQYGVAVYGNDKGCATVQDFPDFNGNTPAFREKVLMAVQRHLGVHKPTKKILEVRIQETGVRIMGESWEVIYGNYNLDSHAGVCWGFMKGGPDKIIQPPYGGAS